MEEFQALLKNATGNEKEIFALLVKQLDFLKELGTNVYKADSDEKDTPKFLVAFYERAGKKQIIPNIRRF